MGCSGLYGRDLPGRGRGLRPGDTGRAGSRKATWGPATEDVPGSPALPPPGSPALPRPKKRRGGRGSLPARPRLLPATALLPQDDQALRVGEPRVQVAHLSEVHTALQL